MSSWSELFGGVVSKGLDIYEAKEFAKLGIQPVNPAPNNGTTGGAAYLPDQSAVAEPQVLGPVGSPSAGGTVTFAGVTLDKSVLQLTALVLVGLWAVGKIG